MSEPDDDAPQFRVDHLRPVDHAIARAIMGETWQQSALAAGWISPQEAEALRTEAARVVDLEHGNKVQNDRGNREQSRAEKAEARAAELESSWVRPERVEEIAALARQLGEALKRETAKQYREYQYVQVRDALDAYREALGSGKLRIVRAE